MTQPLTEPRPVGILVNPSSGRDVRRIAARASVMTIESKRDQVARAVVGAAASGATRILVVRDLLRIADRAVEIALRGPVDRVIELDDDDGRQIAFLRRRTERGMKSERENCKDERSGDHARQAGSMRR